MPFFQNPFSQDFDVSWYTGNSVDAVFGHDAIRYVIGKHVGRTDEYVVSVIKSDTMDLSGNDPDGNPLSGLSIICNAQGSVGWNEIVVDLSTAISDLSQATFNEIAAALNQNNTFATFFQAHINNKKLYIQTTKKHLGFKFYVKNGGAEHALRFNAGAGVGELPSTMIKYEIKARVSAEHHLSALVPLSVSSLVDKKVIEDAVDSRFNPLNLTPTEQADWELLAGRTSNFRFKKNTVDNSDRIVEQLVYNAGSKVGDLAHLVKYTYTGSNKTPDEICEIPHVLTNSDLITP